MNKKVLALFTTALSIGTLGVAVISNNNSIIKPVDVIADSPVIELTNDNLKDTVLEDFVIEEGKTDKKFKIVLDGGRYILGAIFFNDCGHQYVGNTLSDAFGIDNNVNSTNAWNFHFVFSLENVTRIEFNYKLSLTESGGTTTSKVQNVLTGIKSKVIDDKFTHDQDFYDFLEAAGYNNILSDEMGSGNFYYSVDTNKTSGQEISLNEKEKPFGYFNSFGVSRQIVVARLSYNGSFIEKYRKLEYVIDNIRFEYSCD